MKCILVCKKKITCEIEFFYMNSTIDKLSAFSKSVDGRKQNNVTFQYNVLGTLFGWFDGPDGIQMQDRK